MYTSRCFKNTVFQEVYITKGTWVSKNSFMNTQASENCSGPGWVPFSKLRKQTAYFETPLIFRFRFQAVSTTLTCRARDRCDVGFLTVEGREASAWNAFGGQPWSWEVYIVDMTRTEGCAAATSASRLPLDKADLHASQYIELVSDISDNVRGVPTFILQVFIVTPPLPDTA
jgi:hypothetical protein